MRYDGWTIVRNLVGGVVSLDRAEFGKLCWMRRSKTAITSCRKSRDDDGWRSIDPLGDGGRGGHGYGQCGAGDEICGDAEVAAGAEGDAEEQLGADAGDGADKGAGELQSHAFGGPV